MKPNPVTRIRTFFQNCERDQILWDVWMILSALRGPDDNNTDLKNKTTTEIRQRLLTKSMANTLLVSSFDQFQDKPSDDQIFYSNSSPEHFYRHYELAKGTINRSLHQLTFPFGVDTYTSTK